VVFVAYYFSYRGKFTGEKGLEPLTFGFGDHCSTFGTTLLRISEGPKSTKRVAPLARLALRSGVTRVARVARMAPQLVLRSYD
jgi:hypothetical protein